MSIERSALSSDRSPFGRRKPKFIQGTDLDSKHGAQPMGVVQIVTMVKPFRAGAVLEALDSSEIEILGGTVREAMGYGRQKNRLHRYLGSEYNASFLPKVELTLFVREQDVAAVVKAIVGQARTGRMGDGKIIITPCLGEFISW
jgi:nitrogen regulatory protein P-II 1